MNLATAPGRKARPAIVRFTEGVVVGSRNPNTLHPKSCGLVSRESDGLQLAFLSDLLVAEGKACGRDGSDCLQENRNICRGVVWVEPLNRKIESPVAITIAGNQFVIESTHIGESTQ
jgi:hypothetical protein